MKPVSLAATVAAVLAAVLFVAAPGAHADEDDDLQVMIDRARSGVTDLERLDERGAARDETTVLRVWLDEAWRLRSEHKPESVRIVLDRCDAQAEMIRHKIQASKLSVQAGDKEGSLKRVRDHIDKTKKAIQQAMLQKAGLEARAK
jgi:hypothetical protein